MTLAVLHIQKKVGAVVNLNIINHFFFFLVGEHVSTSTI